MKTKIFEILFLTFVISVVDAKADERQFDSILPPNARFENEISAQKSYVFTVNQKFGEVKRFLEGKGISLTLKNQAGVFSGGIYQDWVVHLTPGPIDPKTKRVSNITTITFTQIIPRGGMIKMEEKNKN